MTSRSKPAARQRKRHSEEFKSEALALAAKIGISSAAKQLGLHDSQLYGWRTKAKVKDQQSDAEQHLATENARLKRQLAEQAEELAILKKAAAYFARNVK